MAIFTVTMNGVAVSALQDLYHVKAGSVYPILIHSLQLGQKGLTAVEAKEVVFLRHTATVTQGSGGSSPTPQPVANLGATSGATVHMNDTTPASAGTLTAIGADTWQFLNGLFWLPPPEDRPLIVPGTGFIVKLPTAPSGAMTVYGTLTFEELGL